MIDPSLLGECRAFLRDPVAAEYAYDDLTGDAAMYTALDRAYKFNQFKLFDLAKTQWYTSEQFNFPGGYDGTFSYQQAFCATYLVCCSYGDGCEYAFGSSGVYAAAGMNDNPYYDASYAALDECTALSYYPLACTDDTVAMATFGVDCAMLQYLGYGVPINTDTSDCADRYAMFEAATAAGTAQTTIQSAVMNLTCFFTGEYACSPTLGYADFDWTVPVADENSLVATVFRGECAMWDGGAKGLGLFPCVASPLCVRAPRQLVLRNLHVAHRESF